MSGYKITNSDGVIIASTSGKGLGIPVVDSINNASNSAPEGSLIYSSATKQIYRFDGTQDIITSGTSGYVALFIRKNGSNISENLISNTNGQWDGINGVITTSVNANDVINFYYSGAEILSFDPGTWSMYSFIWASR